MLSRHCARPLRMTPAYSMQDVLNSMHGSPKMRVLVIQFWVHDSRPIRDALAACDIDADLVRVDIEPAVNAALSWGRYGLVIYDPTTTSVSLAAVEQCMRANQCAAPLVVADDLSTLGARALAALRGNRS